MNESSCVFEIIDQTIKSSENRLSVKELCKTAGVSRSGYYAWVKAAPAREAAEEQDRMDFSLILEAYKVRGYKKGAESIYMNLLHMEPPVVMNLKKIRRLMKKFASSVRYARQTPIGAWPKRSGPATLQGTCCSASSKATGPGWRCLQTSPISRTMAHLLTCPQYWTHLQNRYWPMWSVQPWK